jgi:hypothetical protein
MKMKLVFLMICIIWQNQIKLSDIDAVMYMCSGTSLKRNKKDKKNLKYILDNEFQIN